MASPQTENGFTKIANEVLEALARIRIPGEARQVVDVILRKTWGYNKKFDQISLSQFAKLTGLKRPTVARALKKALKIGVIKKDNTCPVTYCFEKDYYRWHGGIKKDTMVSKMITEGGIKKDNLGGIKKASNKRKNTTKENNTKESKNVYGAYRHVYLSKTDYAKLIGKLGDTKTAEWITTLDEGIELKGYKYNSHYLAILKWIEKEKKSDTLISESEKCQYDNKIICSYNCSGCDKQKRKIL